MRESQNLIVSTQKTSFSSQASTNRILADVVNNLELTMTLVERCRDSRGDSKIVAQVLSLSLRCSNVLIVTILG